MKRWLLVLIAALPTPALAGWEFANWGMAPDQVVAASNGAAARVAEDKDKRIRDMARLASGRAIVDGVNYTIDYFFDPKAKTLSAINFVPADADCDAAIAGFKARLGTPKEKRKETVLDPRKPPLVTVEYEWRGGALGKDKVSGVDVSVREMDIRYCQFLRSS
jgi:hypothetical protein